MTIKYMKLCNCKASMRLTRNMVGANIINSLLTRQSQGLCNHSVRWMVAKTANRAAVHGSKLPVPDTIPKNEVNRVVDGAIEEKVRKRVEIENRVDSHLKNWKVIHLDQILCSK